MRLYYSPVSSNSRRALLAAVHLGVDLDLTVVDLRQGAQRAPDFLGKNPNGKVPVLEDDGFFLWESSAIMQYLADKTPGQTVYPTEVRARADVNRWLFWSAHHFAPAVGALSYEHFVKPLLGKGAPDPDAVSRGEAVFVELARVLDHHLAERKWLAQDRLTLADFAVAAPLMAIERARLPMKGFNRLGVWFARVQVTDAWRKTEPSVPAPPRAEISAASGF
jgi:glutathione S-transferase